MQDEINSTEVKLQKKHFPLIDLTNVTFLETLVQKKYQLNKKIQQYSLGKVYLESKKEKVVFRVFQDADLSIPPLFQKKLNRTTVDDDIMTTSSQIQNANRQNKRDLLQSIYNKEKWPKTKKASIEEMENSLFGSDEEPKTYFTQQFNNEHNSTYFQSQ